MATQSQPPCASDWRPGDERDPSSAFFESSSLSGSTFAQFPWELTFEPPHPIFGANCMCALWGNLDHVDEAAPLSRKEKAALAAGVDFDPQEPRRSYQGLRLMGAHLPDGRQLSIAQLIDEPGFGDPKLQLDDLAAELFERAVEADQNPQANKKALAQLRGAFNEASRAHPSRKP